MTEDHEPRPGEIRAVNLRVRAGITHDGQPLWRHQMEQYYDGRWKPIRVYDEGEDGKLREVPQ